MPVYRDEVEKTFGLKFYARRAILSPCSILTVAVWCRLCLVIKCSVGSSLDFSDAEGQRDIPASAIRKLQKTHYRILLSAGPLSPWEILLYAGVCCHSFTAAAYLTLPIPMVSSQFGCFSLRCRQSCTWRSQQPDVAFTSAYYGTEMPHRNMINLACVWDRRFNKCLVTLCS